MPSRNKKSKENPSKELYAAIERRDSKVFQRLIARVPDVKAVRSSDGQSLLEYAMFIRGAEDIAIALIEAGAKLGPRELNLVWAVMTLRPDLVRKFIDAGANPNADAPIGTPLGVAASWPRSRKPAADDSTLTQIVRMLLDAGADVNFAGACGTPLSGAVLENNTGPALALIAAGADLRPASPLDDPLLIQAIRHRNARIARALIDAGADVSEPARNGMSPAVLAQKFKRDEILAMIQGRTAKPVPRKGQTPATRAKPKAKATAAAAAVAKSPEPIQGSPAFRQAVAELEGLCGAKAFPLEGTAGFTVHVDSRSGLDLDKAFKEFQQRGFLLFAADMDASRVVILPTADEYVAVEAMGTNGANYGLSPEDVIRWLRDLEKTHPFELTGIGFDFLKGRFTQPVSKPAALAKQMAEFCPGDDYEPAFARDLKKDRRFTFWWD